MSSRLSGSNKLWSREAKIVGTTRVNRVGTMWFDYAKLLVLGVLMCFVVYSSVIKYWSFAHVATTVSIRTLSADYDQYCGNYKSSTDKFEACKVSLDGAVDLAETRCKGYLDQEAVCFSQHGQHSSRCQAKTNSVDGCVAAICKSGVADGGF